MADVARQLGHPRLVAHIGDVVRRADTRAGARGSRDACSSVSPSGQTGERALDDLPYGLDLDEEAVVAVEG